MNSGLASSSAALVRLPAVLSRLGLSRSTLYAMVAERSFPAPVPIGRRARAWLSSDLDAWVAARIAERDQGRAA